MTRAIVSRCSLFATEFGVALINDSVKGKGYGSRAIKLLIDYAFNTLGFEKIIADTVLQNVRSQHILEKIGFKLTHEAFGFKYYELDYSKGVSLKKVYSNGGHLC